MLRLIVLSALLFASLGVSTAIPSERILGGSEVGDIRDVHYVVSIRFKGSHICGGTVIALQHVITAAECVKGLYVHDITVHIGSKYLTGQSILHEAYIMYVHSKYNSVTKDFDVAILKVKTKFDPFDTVLIGYDDLAPNRPIMAYGWGVLNDTGETQFSNVLHQVEMLVMDRDVCQKWYLDRPGLVIKDSMTCTEAEGKGTCNGDFGGPMIDQFMGKPHILGVSIRSSLYCGRKDYPNVFFNLGPVQAWIKSVAGV